MTERYLSNGLRALQAGTGDTTVVMVSGWPQTAEAFLPLFPLLESHFHLLAIDPPGLGLSAAPPNSNYSTLSVSRFMHEAVMSAISKPYHLVGHDIGAWLMYPWAHQFEDQLLSVTFIDATIPGLAEPRTYPLPYDVNIKLFQFAFNRLPELPEILTAGRERQMLDWLFNQKSRHPERITARDFYAKCYSAEGAMGRGFDYYREIEKNISDNQKMAGEKMLKLPVIAIAGSHGVGDSMRAATQIATDGEVSGSVIEDCGHYVMEEQPERTAEILLAAFRHTKA